MNQEEEDIFDFTCESLKDEELMKPTPMKDYYVGKTIFITGGTGFLGQLYIEKLLRSDVKMIYLLTRTKKGIIPSDRIKSIFSGTLFYKLSKHDPHYLKRIRIIEGDLSELKLGISEVDLDDIYENVDIVLHAAADVRFDEKLIKLIMINLRGTRELLAVAEKIKKLQVLCYISTAYSNCYRFQCDEVFYEPPIDPNTLIKFGEQYIGSPKEDELEILTERIIKPWPNSYSYSKSMSEELVRRFGQTHPVCVVRPSIVISTHEDPIPAWCNNVYGLNGVLVACGMGVLRLMPLDTRMKGDIICADFVINSTLATIWFTNKEQEKLFENIQTQIVHVNTTEDRPATWGEITDEMDSRASEHPNQRMLWIQCPNSTICPFMWKYLTIFYHVIPGAIIDFWQSFKGKSRRLLPVYRKVQRFMEALRFFMTNEWRFTNKNMKRIWNEMTPADQEFYPSDVRRYDWKTFSYNYNHGLRKYIGLEPMTEADKAKKLYNKILFFHYIILGLYYGFHLSLFYMILKYFEFFNYLHNSTVNTYEFIMNPN